VSIDTPPTPRRVQKNILMTSKNMPPMTTNARTPVQVSTRRQRGTGRRGTHPSTSGRLGSSGSPSCPSVGTAACPACPPRSLRSGRWRAVVAVFESEGAHQLSVVRERRGANYHCGLRIAGLRALGLITGRCDFAMVRRRFMRAGGARMSG
jgi:hypothetical protein